MCINNNQPESSDELQKNKLCVPGKDETREELAAIYVYIHNNQPYHNILSPTFIIYQKKVTYNHTKCVEYAFISDTSPSPFWQVVPNDEGTASGALLPV